MNSSVTFVCSVTAYSVRGALLMILYGKPTSLELGLRQTDRGQHIARLPLPCACVLLDSFRHVPVFLQHSSCANVTIRQDSERVGELDRPFGEFERL